MRDSSNSSGGGENNNSTASIAPKKHAANTTMVFTWSLELVLLGLIGWVATQGIGGSAFDRWITVTILSMSCACTLLHVVCCALRAPYHCEVSTSFLAIITGLFVTVQFLEEQQGGDNNNNIASSSSSWFAGDGPVHRAAQIAFMCVVYLASLGMTFASAGGGTTYLMCHPTVLVGVLWPPIAYLVSASTCSPGWAPAVVLTPAAAVLVFLFIFRRDDFMVAAAGFLFLIVWIGAVSVLCIAAMHPSSSSLSRWLLVAVFACVAIGQTAWAVDAISAFAWGRGGARAVEDAAASVPTAVVVQGQQRPSSEASNRSSSFITVQPSRQFSAAPLLSSSQLQPIFGNVRLTARPREKNN
jgi:hypothetical protein